jgi:TolB-like protein/DNA-binding SARP family transcriptional activator
MLELHTLGWIDLLGTEGEEVSGVLSQPKRLGLLVYLAVEPGPHRRDTLLTLFWPERDETHARNALSQSLTYLRHWLADDAFLGRGSEQIGLVPGTLQSDVEAFDAALRAGRWTNALDLYKGDFLRGFHVGSAWGFEEWVEEERLRLREAAAHAAWSLAREQVKRGALVEARRTAEKALGLVCADESPAREFMSALACAGDRAAALSFFESYCDVLKRELELEPSPATMEVAGAIRAGEENPQGIGSEAPQAPTLQQSPVPDITGGAEEGCLPGSLKATERLPAGGVRPMGEMTAALTLTDASPQAGRRSFSKLLRVVVGIAALVMIAVVASQLLQVRVGGRVRRLSLAVLPLDNLSPNSEDDFFAGGVQDDLITKLQRIPTLAVISRTSVERYREPANRQSIRQIAAELGADYLVEGSVRIAADSVWITLQLSEGATDVHRWAETYSASYSPESYVRLQAEMVQRIASDLRVAISPEDKAWLEAVPTADLEAFEAYMRGKEAFFAERLTAAYSSAFPSTDFLAEAVALDPGFALAHAALAHSLCRGSDLGGNWNLGRRAAERALALAGEIFEARIALQRCYSRIGNEEEADRQLELAARIAPDNSEVLRRQADRRIATGDYEGAIETYERAERLDPLDPLLPRLRGKLLQWLHRYDEALAAIDREIALLERPQFVPFYYQARIHLARGELDRARAAISDGRRAKATFPYNQFVTIAGTGTILRIMDPEERRIVIDLFAQDYLERSGDLSCSDPDQVGFWYCIKSALHESEVGSAEKARILWDSLRVHLPHERDNTEPLLTAAQALVFMEVGEKEAALETARTGIRQFATDGTCPSLAFRGDDLCSMLARILTRFGDYGEAIDLLEQMLPPPSWLTVHFLEIDPVWDPLRDHPRFQALLEEYADDVEH